MDSRKKPSNSTPTPWHDDALGDEADDGDFDDGREDEESGERDDVVSDDDD